MDYKYISEILTHNKIEFNKIQDAKIVKIGCLTYSLEDDEFEDEENEFTDSQEEELNENDYPSNYPKQVIEAIEKHPNVFKSEHLEPETTEFWSRSPSEYHEFISTDQIHRFKIEIPERHQKYSSYLKSKSIEKFEVLFKGSTYIAYADVSDFRGTYIAHEFREIVTKQVKSETPFFSNTLGPCPIHPDIHLVSVESDQQNEKDIDIIEGKEDIIIINYNHKKTNELLKSLLWSIDMDIIEFYELMSGRSDLILFNQIIKSLFQRLSESVQNRTQVKWYQFFKANKILNESKELLSDIHTNYFDFEQKQIWHNEKREEFYKDVEDNRFLRYFKTYLYKHSRSNTEIPSSFKSSVDHFERSMTLFSNTRNVIQASITGAIVGSILTGIITYLITINNSV